MGQGNRKRFHPHIQLPALPDGVVQVRRGVTSASDSAGRFHTRDEFDAFAVLDDVPGVLGVREVKFLIENPQSDRPILHLMNVTRNPLHYEFARDFLGYSDGHQVFNRVTYFTEDREFLAGTIVAYDNFQRPDGTQGLYALEFWPTDPISTHYVAQAFTKLRYALSFAAETLAYHPSGDVQERLLIRDAEEFAAHAVRTVSTAEVFEGIAYNPLNLGTAHGILRVMSGDDPRPPSPSDIVIYDTLPNDLPIVAGVISSAPQTPLSHVNLRAQQNDIPNAYLRDAGNDPTLMANLGTPVRVRFLPDRIAVAPISQSAMFDALDARRPSQPQTPARDLSERRIRALDDLGFGDSAAYGAKACNLAELRRAIDPRFVPDGFAVPFSFYHDFMVANGLDVAVAQMLADPDMNDDTLRGDILKSMRKTIKAAPMTSPMRDQLDRMHRAFPEGTTPRCRSSANNEDMVGFTGAGLYDSYTHRLDEGHIEKSVKQVWASLWTRRAFAEREFYRIDHMSAAMGVLVHPNFDDEQVNGVALTRNFYFPTFEGYYINAQLGENLVTNPDGPVTAEEVLLLEDFQGASTQVYEAVYVRRSSLVEPDDTVISIADLTTLALQLKQIQKHFGLLYGRQSDDTFAMDVEFKIDRNGLLAIKQARPWVQ